MSHKDFIGGFRQKAEEFDAQAFADEVFEKVNEFTGKNTDESDKDK